MESVFTKMLNGLEPCVWVGQDQEHAAILEARPLLPGHTIVFPKIAPDALFDMDPAALAGLMKYCQAVARALKAEIACEKIGVLVYGIQTRHAHVHLIPLQGDAGEINLDKIRPAVSTVDLESMAARLRPLIK
jgi:histidine triad (HIT) family protein